MRIGQDRIVQAGGRLKVQSGHGRNGLQRIAKRLAVGAGRDVIVVLAATLKQVDLNVLARVAHGLLPSPSTPVLELFAEFLDRVMHAAEYGVYGTILNVCNFLEGNVLLAQDEDFALIGW